jgi:glycyl-tRNA synthetase beta chain
MRELRDLLVEIGTEELPPKALFRLAAAFRDNLCRQLREAGLEPGAAHAYATPRRLAVLVRDLPVSQADHTVVRRGPSWASAFDAKGNPTKAALGFARSCGVGLGELERLETDKGTWLVNRTEEPGEPAADLIPALTEHALGALPIPKRMRWGDGDAEFIRPVHWVVMLLGGDVIDTEILGARTDRYTRGHRFHHPGMIALHEPATYAQTLESEGRVIADPEQRREIIRRQAVAIGQDLGGSTLIDDALLEEVTALVEWPVSLHGSFDTRFLELPSEVLISTMQDHQKYFPVGDHGGRLMPHFVTVSNIDSRDPVQVRSGNERVIRPRLSDAAFFWEQDRKHSLESRIAHLAGMVFQEQLGSLAEKQERVAAVATVIAERIGIDPRHAERAAWLGKCDLLTSMVFEFPELQGIMGRYYAEHDGEPEEVAVALDEQYKPRFAGDELPSSGTGQALAIADRLDTLVGIFAIGQPPSGDKDPFALRRAAVGVLRILIEQRLDLDLEELLDATARQFAPSLNAMNVVAAVGEFMMERLRAYYLDAGIAPDVYDAVHARHPTRPRDFDRRIRAVSEFRRLPEAESLAAANKRIRNILRKADNVKPSAIRESLMKEQAEIALCTAVTEHAMRVQPLLAEGDYTRALRELAGLREPVDRFFDDVLVMADDSAVRDNRLALLESMASLFLQVADISRLQGGASKGRQGATP